MTPRADGGPGPQPLSREGHPAWARHPVILPWSKSPFQNPDKQGATRAAWSPRTAVHRPGVNQFSVREREGQTEGVIEKGVPRGQGPERHRYLPLIEEFYLDFLCQMKKVKQAQWLHEERYFLGLVWNISFWRMVFEFAELWVSSVLTEPIDKWMIVIVAQLEKQDLDTFATHRSNCWGPSNNELTELHESSAGHKTAVSLKI